MPREDRNVVTPWMDASDDEVNHEWRKLAEEAVRAVAFLDKVRAASSEEQAAVGCDHLNWIESVVRELAGTA